MAEIHLDSSRRQRCQRPAMHGHIYPTQRGFRSNSVWTQRSVDCSCGLGSFPKPHPPSLVFLFPLNHSESPSTDAPVETWDCGFQTHSPHDSPSHHTLDMPLYCDCTTPYYYKILSLCLLCNLIFVKILWGMVHFRKMQKVTCYDLGPFQANDL